METPIQHSLPDPDRARLLRDREFLTFARDMLNNQIKPTKVEIMRQVRYFSERGGVARKKTKYEYDEVVDVALANYLWAARKKLPGVSEAEAAQYRPRPRHYWLFAKMRDHLGYSAADIEQIIDFAMTREFYRVNCCTARFLYNPAKQEKNIIKIRQEMTGAIEAGQWSKTVSYTHLTLPTKA